jgi:hypothetical protein
LRLETNIRSVLVDLRNASGIARNATRKNDYYGFQQGGVSCAWTLGGGLKANKGSRALGNMFRDNCKKSEEKKNKKEEMIRGTETT